MVKLRGRALGRSPIAVTLTMVMLTTVLTGLLSGCNTTAGFGEDMQSAGRGVEHSAEKNK